MTRPPAGGPPAGRDATRAALLDAARLAFTAHGYDGAGVRDIAGAVGVNAALVNRYFGSKRALFEEVVADSFTVGDLLVGDRHTLGPRLARFLVGRRADTPAGDGAANGHEPGRFDPTLVLLRSAASPDAAPVLRDALETQVAAPLAAWLGAPDADARAHAVVAVLFGVALTRDVLGARADADATVRHLGDALQRLLDGGR